MKKRELVCIICPRGCLISAELDGGVPKRIEGYSCRRGKKYAEDECTAPVRTVTSTVRCPDGHMLPVKTDIPIPKEHIADCIRIINSLRPPQAVSIGDVLAENVFGSRIIAAANSEQPKMQADIKRKKGR